MFQDTKWHVVASGVRVFLGFLGPSVGVSHGKNQFFFPVVKLERSSFTGAEQLLNNACVYLQVSDFFPRFFEAFNQL